MPDQYLTTPDPRRPMVCATCQVHFNGRMNNLISAVGHSEQVVALAYCDDCLAELGAISRA